MMNEKPVGSRRLLPVVALATIAATWTALPSAANAADAGAGKQLFQDKTCAACHTIGKGPLVGPDLKDVTKRRPHDWLEQWIMAPDAVLAKKDEYAVKLMHEYHDMAMPNLGLSKGDVDNILAYLDSASAGGAAAESAPAAEPAAQGNADTGKELFTGVARFQNGGPPCMACHSTGGIGALGGGALGPDLTTVATRMGGPAGVNAFITGLPTHHESCMDRASAAARRAGQCRCLPWSDRGEYTSSGSGVATGRPDRIGCCNPAVSRGHQLA
jgi:cytochrome c2